MINCIKIILFAYADEHIVPLDKRTKTPCSLGNFLAIVYGDGSIGFLFLVDNFLSLVKGYGKDIQGLIQGNKDIRSERDRQAGPEHQDQRGGDPRRSGELPPTAARYSSRRSANVILNWPNSSIIFLLSPIEIVKTAAVDPER